MEGNRNSCCCCCYFLDTNRKSPSHFNLLELKAQKYMKPHQKELAIEFGPINEQNVGQVGIGSRGCFSIICYLFIFISNITVLLPLVYRKLKKLNSACFPISYNDSFYKEVSVLQVSFLETEFNQFNSPLIFDPVCAKGC